MNKKITNEKMLEELKEKLGETFFYKTLIEIEKLMKATIKEEVSLKNQFIMVGAGVKLNDIFKEINECEEKKKWENRFQEIWEEWYLKQRNFINKKLHPNIKEEENTIRLEKE